ncbi:interferon lambda receptor 1 [Polymixia lowei]
MRSAEVIVLLLHCYGCLFAAAAGRPTFISRNFANVLHWERATQDTPGEEVLYSVQYKSYEKDEPYQTKAECRNITALSCDLTAETPFVSDVHYIAEVYAKGRLHGRTYRFKPIAETVLGPPTLSLSPTASSLRVNATLPLGPNGVSIADIFNSSNSLFGNPSTLYTLYITSPKWAAQRNTSATGRFVINLKNNNTEYCGYVVYKPTFELGRRQSENASFCVKLPGKPWMLFPWFLVAAALLMVPVVISVVFICHYVKGVKESSMPDSLVTDFTIQPQMKFPDTSLFISILEVLPRTDQRVCTVHVKPKLPSGGSGGYSPQVCDDPPWDSGSSVGTGLQTPPPGHLDTEDTSTQSSVIYSGVCVHVPGEDAKELQQATDHDRVDIHPPRSSTLKTPSRAIGGTSPKLLPQPLPLPDFDCQHPVEPLSLHTERDIEGRLTFSSFTFHVSQSATAVTGLAATPEGKPLLSDLVDNEEGTRPFFLSLDSVEASEWSDSGCQKLDGKLSVQETENRTAYEKKRISFSTSIPSAFQKRGLPHRE